MSSSSSSSSSSSTIGAKQSELVRAAVHFVELGPQLRPDQLAALRRVVDRVYLDTSAMEIKPSNTMIIHNLDGTTTTLAAIVVGLMLTRSNYHIMYFGLDEKRIDEFRKALVWIAPTNTFNTSNPMVYTFDSSSVCMRTWKYFYRGHPTVSLDKKHLVLADNSNEIPGTQHAKLMAYANTSQAQSTVIVATGKIPEDNDVVDMTDVASVQETSTAE